MSGRDESRPDKLFFFNSPTSFFSSIPRQVFCFQCPDKLFLFNAPTSFLFSMFRKLFNSPAVENSTARLLSPRPITVHLLSERLQLFICSEKQHEY
jgi:hypothetical protein